MVDESVAIVERQMGYRMNVQQQDALSKIMRAEPGKFCSIPMPRGSGKTTLAIALMKLLPRAMTIVPSIYHASGYEEFPPVRVRTGTPDIRGYEPDLVIFDEHNNMPYMEHCRRYLPNVKFLHIYTPHGPVFHQGVAPFEMWTQEFMGNATVGIDPAPEPVTRARAEQQYADMTRRQELVEEMLDDIGDFLLPELRRKKKKEDREWDEEENT